MEWNTIQKHRNLKLSDHKDMTSFNVTFNQLTIKLKELKIPYPNKVYIVKYIMIVQAEFPI